MSSPPGLPGMLPREDDATDMVDDATGEPSGDKVGMMSLPLPMRVCVHMPKKNTNDGQTWQMSTHGEG